MAALQCRQPRLLLPCGSAVLMGLKWLSELLPSQWGGKDGVATPGHRGGYEILVLDGHANLFYYYRRRGKIGKTIRIPSQESKVCPNPSNPSQVQSPSVKLAVLQRSKSLFGTAPLRGGCEDPVGWYVLRAGA